MSYPPRVLDYFEHPRRAGSLPASDPDVGTGLVRAADRGDTVKLQVRIDRARGEIVDARFKAYGCGWTIACASLAADRLPGRTLDEARCLDASAIARELDLPDDRRHCAALAADAIAVALDALAGQRSASDVVR